MDDSRELARAPPNAALTKHEIIEKLNAVPTFCLLNSDQNIVAMVDPEGGEGEVCLWFTDADDARRMLAVALEQNPDALLHLGVTPLGLAFALAERWAESPFVGDMRLQGNRAVVASMGPMLREQLAAQGLPAGAWQLPLFCCDELSSARVMPVFLSRADLVAAWEASGRSKESLPANLAVIELKVFVAQMQTDAFAWSSVAFVGSPRSVALVRQSKLASARAAGKGGPPPTHASTASAGAGGDVPAGDDDDEPPPLV
uniref:Uncharacterized protein n=1 Tax=Calcidiscus leptoporus TaxID=127549 RepID=A0A7S0NWM0_9EUKA|mmetsp:Transcript_34465/g.80737  ORF Transcript_34465/g.80737 Transcript_34465/m.80737 type:complete len:258 (+) Transcript_34465:96-869(+)